MDNSIRSFLISGMLVSTVVPTKIAWQFSVKALKREVVSQPRRRGRATAQVKENKLPAVLKGGSKKAKTHDVVIADDCRTVEIPWFPRTRHIKVLSPLRRCVCATSTSLFFAAQCAPRPSFGPTFKLCALLL